MSLKTDQLLHTFTEALKKSQETTKPYDTTAEVTRVDGDTVWVHIPSGVYETPIRKTINCVKGDIVQIRVAGGTAWITGNATKPPTDDTVAINAQQEANKANAEAIDAKQTADTAQITADTAQITADTAQESIIGEGGINDRLEVLSKSVVIDQNEPSVSIQTGTALGETKVKVTNTRISMVKNDVEVAYITTDEDESVIDINNARIHDSIKIGELEIIEFRGGIGIRRA